MADDSNRASSSQSDATDIDDLLRAAATLRPSAEVEEQLLLRLRDEVAPAHERHPTVDDLDPPVVELAARADSAHSRGIRTVVAAAAAIVLIVGALAVLTQPDPATETDRATQAPAVAAIELIDAACASSISKLVAVDRDDYPAGLGEDEARREWTAEIRDATAALRDAVSADGSPAATAEQAELEQLVDQLNELVDATDDRNRTAIASSAETFARRAVLIANDLALLGAGSCETPPE